jgi:hypothetical protein
MRGEMVIVRSFGGRPLVRRVWAADARAVYICGEREFRQLAAGQEAPPPVGFPREDVFAFEPALAAAAERAYNPEQWDWGRLAHWEGNVG